MSECDFQVGDILKCIADERSARGNHLLSGNLYEVTGVIDPQDGPEAIIEVVHIASRNPRSAYAMRFERPGPDPVQNTGVQREKSIEDRLRELAELLRWEA